MKNRLALALVGLIAAGPALAARAPSTLEQANAYTDAAVAAEASARKAEDTTEAGARQAAVAAEAKARGDADTQEASLRELADQDLQQQIEALGVPSGGGGLPFYSGKQLLGTVLNFNPSNYSVTVITSKGYLLDVVIYPGGIGQASILFASSDCSGQAYIPTDLWRPKQGFIAALSGDSPPLYYVPRGSTATQIALASGLGSAGRCNLNPTIQQAAPALPNDPSVTGISGTGTLSGPFVFGAPL